MLRTLKGEGVRVPDGFATTADAYRDYVASNRATIGERLEALKSGKAPLHETGAALRQAFLNQSRRRSAKPTASYRSHCPRRPAFRPGARRFRERRWAGDSADPVPAITSSPLPPGSEALAPVVSETLETINLSAASPASPSPCHRRHPVHGPGRGFPGREVGRDPTSPRRTGWSARSTRRPMSWQARPIKVDRLETAGADITPNGVCPGRLTRRCANILCAN
jgi:hypothetical protein